MELIIQVVDNTNADAEKDRRGCYKRGDIIEVCPDGETVDKPWLNVLIVPGIDHLKVMRFFERSFKIVQEEVKISEAEFQAVKDQVQVIKYNDQEYTVYLGRFIDPVLVSNINGVRTYNCKVVKTLDRRRFRIPAGLMNTLFATDNRRTITKAQFLNHMDNLIDKFSNQALKDTPWYSAYKATV